MCHFEKGFDSCDQDSKQVEGPHLRTIVECESCRYSRIIWPVHHSGSVKSEYELVFILYAEAFCKIEDMNLEQAF